MSSLNENLSKIVGELDSLLDYLGFEKDADFASSETSGAYISEKGAVKFECENGRFSLFSGESTDTASKKLCTFLLEDEMTEGDIRYLNEEIKATIKEKFAKKVAAPKKSNQKTNQTVSKAAVKNGSFYDANTLASKICLVFPDLRPFYKENLSEYGEFMGEEFFAKYGTEKIIAAIKENNPQTMKKMFQILNEIYEDGTNDTQSLIAVSILGQLNNDKILLARCVDYMSETMAPPVIEVNRYLASAAGKKAKKKLENPPVFKPKKEKKPGLFAQAMAQGGGMPPTM